MSKIWNIAGGVAAAAVVAVGLYLNFTGQDVALQTAEAAGGQQVDVNVGDNEIVYGDPAAPVTIVEYASLTCPHCAAFHQEMLPELKAQLLDTGKAKLVYRDFPLDQLALRASVMVRCGPADKRTAMLDTLFSTQRSWSAANDPVEALARIGRAVGMTDDDLNACYQNKEVVDAVLAERLEGEETYKVSSTPSFVIDGKLYRGGMSVEDFTAVVESLTP